MHRFSKYTAVAGRGQAGPRHLAQNGSPVETAGFTLPRVPTRIPRQTRYRQIMGDSA